MCDLAREGLNIVELEVARVLLADPAKEAASAQG